MGTYVTMNGGFDNLNAAQIAELKEIGEDNDIEVDEWGGVSFNGEAGCGWVSTTHELLEEFGTKHGVQGCAIYRDDQSGVDEAQYEFYGDADQSNRQKYKHLLGQRDEAQGALDFFIKDNNIQDADLARWILETRV